MEPLVTEVPLTGTYIDKKTHWIAFAERYRRTHPNATVADFHVLADGYIAGVKDAVDSLNNGYVRKTDPDFISERNSFA